MHVLRFSFWLTLSIAFLAPASALDQRYHDTLIKLSNTLVSTQITDRTSPDYGALVCPSTNPQDHPLHSRAGEAVYPLAIAFQQTGDVRYRDAAMALAHWMIDKQQASGAWGENYPKHDGWIGTTSDQLISLAGAYPIFRGHLTADQRAAWQIAMRKAADHVVATFPIANINYQPTGAVALELASRVVENSPTRWREKAISLMALTTAAINSDQLLVGEGNGVDLGYNLAQSIGYIAMYALLTHDEALRDRAAKMLHAHAAFVYPNGSIDNSWGTRSFKWTYESGTKTAPGVYFSFALLADKDPSFAPLGTQCLDYLLKRNLKDGFVTYGPHGDTHASTNPPCLYSTFARAQSLAMALAFAPVEKPLTIATSSAAAGLRVRYFPTVKVAVVRTEKLIATISAYDGISRYGRELVSRGGSVTNLWIDGFGSDGFAQTSSVTAYRREEAAHMPVETDLRPLTARIETTIDGIYFTNLFDADAQLAIEENSDHIAITASGVLRSMQGDASDISYQITHRFFANRLEKHFTVTSPRAHSVQIIEPIVNGRGTEFVKNSAREVSIRPPSSNPWIFELSSSNLPLAFHAGRNAEKYWCPFPAVNCYPLEISFVTEAGKENSVDISLHPPQ